MKRFLQQYRSRRHGYDGWGVAIKGTDLVFESSVSTTREEAREAFRLMRKSTFDDMVSDLEIIPVKIEVRRARPLDKEQKV